MDAGERGTDRFLEKFCFYVPEFFCMGAGVCTDLDCKMGDHGSGSWGAVFLENHERGSVSSAGQRRGTA